MAETPAGLRRGPEEAVDTGGAGGVRIVRSSGTEAKAVVRGTRAYRDGAGPGNVLRLCRPYQNADEGWDLWMARVPPIYTPAPSVLAPVPEPLKEPAT